MQEVASIDRGKAHAREGLRTWTAVVILGLGTALIVAALLVIATRLGNIERGIQEEVRVVREEAKAKAVEGELERTRYETEVQELHRLEIGVNTLSAWYQEDTRRHDDERLREKR